MIDVPAHAPGDIAPMCTRVRGRVNLCSCDECRLLAAAGLDSDQPLWALGMRVLYPVRNESALHALGRELVNNRVVNIGDLFPSWEQVEAMTEATVVMAQNRVRNC